MEQCDFMWKFTHKQRARSLFENMTLREMCNSREKLFIRVLRCKSFAVFLQCIVLFAKATSLRER
jgi:hypothetical protein